MRVLLFLSYDGLFLHSNHSQQGLKLSSLAMLEINCHELVFDMHNDYSACAHTCILPYYS